jgi:hypothetical protein
MKGAHMIPCYVSGKGMYATATTWEFKSAVIEWLAASQLGYDTRFRYYQQEFPEMPIAHLARLICDPIEFYDRGWPVYWANKKDGRDKDEVLTEYMWQLDEGFQREAKVSIVCYDEAGLGTGINTMRFLHKGKPILGFYNPAVRRYGVNINNILQLKLEFPRLVTLQQYESFEDIQRGVQQWLRAYGAGN